MGRSTPEYQRRYQRREWQQLREIRLRMGQIHTQDTIRLSTLPPEYLAYRKVRELAETERVQRELARIAKESR